LTGDPKEKFTFRQTAINEKGHNFWNTYEKKDFYVSCLSILQGSAKKLTSKINIKWDKT
jgi:hypothetical protein